MCPFHAGMNYIGMVTGNTFRGSGYSRIFIEAGLLVATWGVLKGHSQKPCLPEDHHRSHGEAFM